MIKYLFVKLKRITEIIFGVCLIPVIIISAIICLILYVLNPEEEPKLIEWGHDNV